MRPDEMVEEGLALIGPDRGTVLVDSTSTVNLRWANSTLTTNGLANARQVHVGVMVPAGDGLSAGSASGVVTGRAALADLVERARAAARDAPPAPDAAPEVPGGGILGGDAPGSDVPRGWIDPVAETGPRALAAVSALLGEVLGEPGLPLFGYAEHEVSTTHLGTTAGVRSRFDLPAARFELSGKSADFTRSAWAGRAGQHLADLDLASTVEEVRAGLAAQANRVDVEPGRHRVVLSACATADLLIHLLWSASARDAVEGRSAFSRPDGGTRVGERISDVAFRLWSDPRAPGLTCPDRVQATTSSDFASAFDAGLAIPAVDWIADGHLRSLITTRHSAGLSGLPVAPAADNLLAEVPGSTGSLADVAARVGDGLLVTCLWYIREVDAPSMLVTGLTRDGVYVVRGGEVVGAAGNFRFNESPLDMLGRVADAGAPVDCLPREWADWFTRARVPALAIDRFNLSTPSEAV